MRESRRQSQASPARALSSGSSGSTRDAGAEGILSRRTELVLRELETLPTLPAVASRLLRLGTNDDVDIKEIVRLIETDPTLTARLLSLCRRAATRTRHPITTVEMAVVMLGLEAVRALVLSVEIFEWTNKVPRRTGKPVSARAHAAAPESTATSRFNRVGFWQHSIAVACCADLLCREHPEKELLPEEAFVCGLVHDLGKLALDLVLPRAYARVIDLCEQRRGNIADFERPIVGLDHHTAGARLAQRWGLPEVFCRVIAMHGTPVDEIPDSQHKTMIALVALADSVCRRLCLGWSGNQSTAPDERELCRSAGFNFDRIDSVIPKLYEATSARCRDLGLGDEPSQQLLVESILMANTRLAGLNQSLAETNEALRAAERHITETRVMARLGEMTAGAAHEMNNPLTVISGRAQALAGRLKDERDKAAAGAIVNACTRLTDLIGRLHRIANPPKPLRQQVDVGELLGEVVRRAKLRIAEKAESRVRGGAAAPVINVKLFVGEALEPAKVDPVLLTDALVEMVVNAIEAGPRGTVEVRAQINPSDDSLRISVIDDGVGMSEHALNHALDPFFSEKPSGRQPGLGLALAHRLIQLHDGEIYLTSKPGKGTSATASLRTWRIGRDSASSIHTPRLSTAA